MYYISNRDANICHIHNITKLIIQHKSISKEINYALLSTNSPNVTWRNLDWYKHTHMHIAVII